MSDTKGLDGLDGYGEVDLFGLDEFGQAVGIHPAWGAVIGGGLATGTSIAIRALEPNNAGLNKWSEGIGFAVGAVASGVMIAFDYTKAAGWAGLASCFLSNGLRQLERLFTEEKMEGYGYPAVERLNGAIVERLDGFGVAVPENVPPIVGAVAGPQLSAAPPVDLMQPGALPGSARGVNIMGAGAPSLHGLGAHYGATLFGGSQ